MEGCMSVSVCVWVSCGIVVLNVYVFCESSPTFRHTKKYTASPTKGTITASRARYRRSGEEAVVMTGAAICWLINDT